MHRIGVIAAWLGIIFSVLGLVVGFTELAVSGADGYGFWLSLVPLGFMLLLIGVTLTQLFPKDSKK